MAAVLEVAVDGRKASSGSNVVVRSLERMRGAAAKTDQQFKKNTKTQGEAAKSASTLGRALKGVAVLLVARKLIQYADGWTQVRNRLRLATSSTEELNAVTERVFAISQKSRIGLGSTAELYQRLARSAQQLGISTERTLGVTETISKAITLSGVSADSANAAIVQFGQGLAAGALRGDELRSVLEQTPRLAQALADGLGVPIGQLRKLGEAGELVSASLIDALEGQAAKIDAEFATLGPTIGQAFTVLGNSLTRTIGIFSTATGAAGGFAGIIIKLADFISGPGLEGILSFGDVLAVTFRELSSVGDLIVGSFESIGIDIGPLLGDIGRAILRLPLTLISAFKRILVEFGGFLLRSKNKFQIAVNEIRGVFNVLTGDEEEIDQLAMERAQLGLDSLRLEKELADVRLTLAEDQIAIENELTKAVQDRIQARLDAANADLTKEGAGAGGPSQKDIDAAKKLDEQLAKLGATLTESVQTPLETYTASTKEYLQLLNAGKITQETYNRAVLEAATEYRDGLPAVELYNDQLEEGKRIYEETLTPQEAYRDSILNLNTLLAAGAITQETFGRAVKASQEELIEAVNANDGFAKFMEQISIQAARNIQSAFADFLFDPFSDGLDGLVRGFADTLRRMLSEALSAQVFKFLSQQLASLGGGATGGFGGFLSSVAGAFGGAFADGGDFAAGRPILVGEKGPEVITPRQPGTVVPNGMGQSAAPQVSVGGPTIVNTLEDSAIVSAFNRGGGGTVVLNNMTENQAAYRNALGI